MQLIFECSAGYALFKAKDKKLLKSDTLAEDFSTVEGTVNALKLKKFLVRTSAPPPTSFADHV
jgi:nucleolar protein 58